MAGGFTIKHDNELERACGVWVLVRRSLGLGSFGLNAVELPQGESIPEHDETGRDQEEVFFVVAGSPTIVIDGSDHPLHDRIVRTPRSRRRCARCETTATSVRPC